MNDDYKLPSRLSGLVKMINYSARQMSNTKIILINTDILQFFLFFFVRMKMIVFACFISLPKDFHCEIIRYIFA